MAETPPESLHVLIIGAGINGLLVAQGLKKHNIPFTIFESEPSATSARSREWGMSIQWALPLLRDLLPEDLHSQLQTTACDPFYHCPAEGTSMPVYNAETGEKMKDIPLVQFLRASRSKLRALLTTNLSIHYNHTLTSLSFPSPATITAHFSNSSTFTAPLLVAADGANSAVRNLLFPDYLGVATRIPFTGINTHVTYHSAETALFIRQAFTPVQTIGMHPRGYWLWLSIQNVPDPEKPEDWTFQLQWTWKISPETAELSNLSLPTLKKEAAECFGEPFRTAWLAIPDSTPLHPNKISIWQPLPLPPSLTGRAALLGDAAHPMPFHRGQGLNHGIADATKFVSELVAVMKGEKGKEEAVLQYEGEMIARAGEEVRGGVGNTEMVHEWVKVRESAFMRRGGDRN